jgi:hypothetical protein
MSYEYFPRMALDSASALIELYDEQAFCFVRDLMCGE